MKLSAILRAWLRKMPGSWITKPWKRFGFVRSSECKRARAPRWSLRHGFQSRLYLQLAGSVSGWRLGGAESPSVGGPPTEDYRGPTPLVVSHRRREESLAVSIRVCSVDALDDSDFVAPAVRSEAEPVECRTAAEAVGADVPASFVASLGARPRAREALARARVSGYSRLGQASGSRDFLCGRGRGTGTPMVRSRRAMGAIMSAARGSVSKRVRRSSKRSGSR